MIETATKKIRSIRRQRIQSSHGWEEGSVQWGRSCYCSCINQSIQSTTFASSNNTAKAVAARRSRTISGSKSEDHFMTTESGRKVYTKGRPPWYDRAGKRLKKSYLIGICGGSASGKTTVAQSIIERLEMPWVTVLSMDSFYKVLNEEQHDLAAHQQYNFDHPMHSTLTCFIKLCFD
uniref:Phosphoribulokinase/uridine kinase domain-containing protein n=1 Tax=Ditylenchus dipsaci TaxID=166011 RepID=A0A915DTS1_9BILA